MRVSGVAIGQWNQICRKTEGVRRTIYKINRAIVMGNVAHKYISNDYVIRYHDMNILISHTGIVLTIWRDIETAPFTIRETAKLKYDNTTTHKDNLRKASVRHGAIIKKHKEAETETLKSTG